MYNVHLNGKYCHCDDEKTAKQIYDILENAGFSSEISQKKGKTLIDNFSEYAKVGFTFCCEDGYMPDEALFPSLGEAVQTAIRYLNHGYGEPMKIYLTVSDKGWRTDIKKLCEVHK